MSDDTDAARIREIIDDVIQRRELGERLTDDDVIAGHPNVADELRQQLHQLQLITNARRQAEKAATDETFTVGVSTSTDSPAPLYCPNCESRWDTAPGRDAETGSCPNCGADLYDLREAEPRPGETIRHYVLLQQIGAGGFGTVWRARDTKLECDVAVKIPRRERLAADDIDRFIREARVSAQLRKHPNIVTVHEADRDDETAFIASDLIDGVSLGDRLAHARIPFDEAADLVATVCGALQHAHEAGIVHRDLKPDNILLDAAGAPHVTDFGLAKQESQSLASEAGQIMGTAAYMSPEQAEGKSDEVDRRSDVFSLGVILFEMLTGERPFRGSAHRILWQIIHEDPPRPRSFGPAIPADLETICVKCLEKDPDRRYQSAAALAEDLRRFRKHEPIVARPVSAGGRLWRWCRRNPGIPWLSLTLLAVTGGSMLTAGLLLDSEVSTMQDRLDEAFERPLRLGAAYAAANASSRFNERFEQVQELMENDVLIAQLQTWNELSQQERDDAIDQLIDGKGSVIPDVLSELQEELRAAAGRQADQFGQQSDTFSWFVCDANGHQIARWNKKETMGICFDFRSYFTGGKSDLAEQYKPEDLEWNVGDPPRLSDSFLTETGDAFVFAISAPIWEGSDFQGVVGIFVELGDLVSLPRIAGSPDQFMAVYDGRAGMDVARPIDHYRYDNPERAAIKLDKIPEVDLRGEFLDDPFYGSDYRFQYERIDDDPESPLHDLYVAMEEKQSVVEDPVTDFRRNLIVLGLSIIGLAAAILIPIWIIILRRVVR